MTDLRAIAEAATPGPWTQTGTKAKPHWYVAAPDALVHGNLPPTREDYVPETIARWCADAAHIAAWSPDRALAALDIRVALEDLIAEAEDYRTHACRDHAAGLHGHLCQSLTAATAALARMEALP